MPRANAVDVAVVTRQAENTAQPDERNVISVIQRVTSRKFAEQKVYAKSLKRATIPRTSWGQFPATIRNRHGGRQWQ